MKQAIQSFSVIIPTYNRPQRLKDCLNAVAGLDYPRDSFETIVVDDGSSASPEPLIEPFRDCLEIKFLAQKNAGPAAARNIAAQNAKGDFLAFTDDDCMVSPKWLSTFADNLSKNPDTLAGGLTVNALPENPFSSASQLLISYLYQYYEDNAGMSRFFTSNNIAVPTTIFNRMGGFEVTRLRATAEDREFCYRWLHHGYRMAYIPEALVYHAHNLTLRSFYYQHFNYGRGAFYYHNSRARRSGEGVKIEPLSFYMNMMRYPFLQHDRRRAFSSAALLTISQAANASGFLWEKIRQRLFGSFPVSENENDKLFS